MAGSAQTHGHVDASIVGCLPSVPSPSSRLKQAATPLMKSGRVMIWKRSGFNLTVRATAIQAW